jgi:hypothetical protein
MSMSAADKRRITADWQRELPGFAAWRPLRLLRRLGPVVQGVTLDLSSSGTDYLPTAHVHALVRPAKVITMTLATPLRTVKGVQDRIKLRNHDQSTVAGAAARLRAQSPLPLDRLPTLAELMAAYEQEIAARVRPGVPMAVTEIEDRVLIPAAVGRTDLVATGLTLARSVSADWPPGSLARWGRSDTWLDDLATTAADPAALHQTIADEVAAHKLENLPTHDLA